MGGPETYYNRANAGMSSPNSSSLTLRTKSRVWDIMIGSEKIGSGGRSVVWKGVAKSGKREYHGVVKSYNPEAIRTLDAGTKSSSDLIKHGVLIQRELRKKGIPTIPTFRALDEGNAILTDLTQGGKNYVIALNDAYGNKDPYFRGKIEKLWYKRKLSFIIKRKLQALRELVIKNGVRINAIDAFFLILPRDPHDINENNVSILVGDLDNVSLSGIDPPRGYMPYDDDYLTERFIGVLK